MDRSNLADDGPEASFPRPTNRAFRDEAVAQTLMEQARWSEGLQCPDCASDRIHRMEGRTQAGMLLCKDCERKFTVRTGTVMHRSHVPLHQWLFAIHLRALPGKPLSERHIGRLLGISSKSAWRLSQCIAQAVDAEAERLIPGAVPADAEGEKDASGRKRRNKRFLFAGRGRMVTLDLAAGTARIGGPEGALLKLREVLGVPVKPNTPELPPPLLLYYAKILTASLPASPRGEAE